MAFCFRKERTNSCLQTIAMNIILCSVYKPGQAAKHALAVSVSLPTQAFPPFITGGRLHNRVLLRIVPPFIPQV